MYSFNRYIAKHKIKTMRIKYAPLLLPFFLMAQPSKEKPLVIGQAITLHSDELNEERVLNIYLPQNYSPTAPPYPVIYLLDGSMDEDFLHITGLVQFASFEWIGKVPESIVVGIANVERQRDFTYPSTKEQDKSELPTSGGSEALILYLEKEVIPEIESRYNASQQRTIIGQSLGGLLAAEILIKKPTLFTHYIIVSPSLWWDEGSLLKVVPQDSSKRNVYIAVGKEGEVMESSARMLATSLVKKHTVCFEYLPEYNHGDLLHFAAYNAFGRFFSE